MFCLQFNNISVSDIRILYQENTIVTLQPNPGIVMLKLFIKIDVFYMMIYDLKKNGIMRFDMIDCSHSNLWLS